MTSILTLSQVSFTVWKTPNLLFVDQTFAKSFK